MAFKRPRARILERSITSGNGPYALAAAVDGSYNRFSSFMSIGDVTEGFVIEPGVASWTGILTYTATNEVTATTVEETNGTFSTGTKEIGCGSPPSISAFPRDIAGAITTGGSSTGYTVSSFRVYDTLARMDGAIIAFTPHVTNGATVTLNVDGLGTKPLRLSPGVELQSNTLIAGTPYTATYNNASGVWYLHGLGGNAYGVPLLGCMDYFGITAPSSAFIFPRGQALSRTTYAAAFAILGTTYGVGDGSTTFNAPNLSGRVTAMLELSATLLTSTYFGGNSTVMGAVGGADNAGVTIGQIHLPNYNLTVTDPGHNHGLNVASGGAPGSSNFVQENSGGSTTTSGNYIGNNTTGISVSSGGSGVALPVGKVQPTMTCNKIMRVT